MALPRTKAFQLGLKPSTILQGSSDISLPPSIFLMDGAYGKIPFFVHFRMDQ